MNKDCLELIKLLTSIIKTTKEIINYKQECYKL